MNKEALKKWAIETGIKTIRTMAQAAIGLIGSTAIVLGEVNWLQLLSGTALAGIICILMNIQNIEYKED